MKPYIKPVLEKVELMPNERLSNASCKIEEVYCGQNPMSHCATKLVL